LGLRRSFDITFAGGLTILTSPLMLAAAIGTYLSVGRPIFFKQERMGLDNKPFILKKFRSMNNKKDDEGNLLGNSQRTTKFGQILRATRIDELPQLFHVLDGTMSMSGPRAIPKEDFHPNDILRHKVKPGITGLSQIRGYGIDTKLERSLTDTWYITQRLNNDSIKPDLLIIAKTPIAIIKNKGTSRKEHEAPRAMI